MGLATFKGGIHPFEGKELSKDCPIKKLDPVGDLVYPLSQHIGAPADAIVKPGDYVLAGQKIGEASAFISANVISSVSGVVKAVEPRLTLSGKKVPSIIVENDKQYKTVEGFGHDRDETKLSKQEIRDIIKEAGIVGMGGAGFPTHVKLTPKDDSKIEYLIINGAECEPYLTTDYRRMLEDTEMMVKGLNVLLRLFENAKGIIGIEDNKSDAITLLQKAADQEPKIEVAALKTKYPQGGERILIYAMTGRKINYSMLPSDVGCIVINADTLRSCYLAVCKSTPLISRVVTISGDAIETPANLEVKVGTNAAELMKACGGYKTEPEKIISGGPMMGTALFSLDVPIVKTSSGLLAFTEDEVAFYEPSACIRCGRCIDVCPAGVIPQKMMEYAERNDKEGFEKMSGMECCECGSCTYICPARRRMTQAFSTMRKAITEDRKNK